MARCTHLQSVKVTELPEAVDGCEDCLAAGGVWLHLRARGETRITPSPMLGA